MDSDQVKKLLAIRVIVGTWRFVPCRLSQEREFVRRRVDPNVAYALIESLPNSMPCDDSSARLENSWTQARIGAGNRSLVITSFQCAEHGNWVLN